MPLAARPLAIFFESIIWLNMLTNIIIDGNSVFGRFAHFFLSKMYEAKSLLGSRDPCWQQEEAATKEAERRQAEVAEQVFVGRIFFRIRYQ